MDVLFGGSEMHCDKARKTQDIIKYDSDCAHLKEEKQLYRGWLKGE